MNSVCLLRTQHSEISMVCMIHLLHLCDYNEEVLKNKRKRCFKYEIIMLENDNSYAQSPGLTQINKQMIEQIHNINL